MLTLLAENPHLNADSIRLIYEIIEAPNGITPKTLSNNLGWPPSRLSKALALLTGDSSNTNVVTGMLAQNRKKSAINNPSPLINQYQDPCDLRGKYLFISNYAKSLIQKQVTHTLIGNSYIDRDFTKFNFEGMYIALMELMIDYIKLSPLAKLPANKTSRLYFEESMTLDFIALNLQCDDVEIAELSQKIIDLCECAGSRNNTMFCICVDHLKSQIFNANKAKVIPSPWTDKLRPICNQKNRRAADLLEAWYSFSAPCFPDEQYTYDTHQLNRFLLLHVIDAFQMSLNQDLTAYTLEDLKELSLSSNLKDKTYSYCKYVLDVYLSHTIDSIRLLQENSLSAINRIYAYIERGQSMVPDHSIYLDKNDDRMDSLKVELYNYSKKYSVKMIMFGESYSNLKEEMRLPIINDVSKNEALIDNINPSVDDSIVVIVDASKYKNIENAYSFSKEMTARNVSTKVLLAASSISVDVNHYDVNNFDDTFNYIDAVWHNSRSLFLGQTNREVLSMASSKIIREKSAVALPQIELLEKMPMNRVMDLNSEGWKIYDVKELAKSLVKACV